MSQLTITRRAGAGGVAILDLTDDSCRGEQNILLKHTIHSLVEQDVKKIVLNFADVTKIDVVPQSLMPEGQLDALKPDEIRDLVRFLMKK